MLDYESELEDRYLRLLVEPITDRTSYELLAMTCEALQGYCAESPR